MRKEENKLTLEPGDYFVSSFGLKIENTNPKMVLEIVMPENVLMYPMEITHQTLER